MHLEHLEWLHSSYKDHQVVVVRLKELLIKYLNSEGVNVRAHSFDVLVHKLEVLMLRQVLKHLLKSQFQEKLSPGEVFSIILDNSSLGNRCNEITMILVQEILSEFILILFSGIEILNLHRIFITQQSEISRFEFFSSSLVGLCMLDPWELFKYSLFPLGALCF